jgi:hypothetical protein
LLSEKEGQPGSQRSSSPLSLPFQGAGAAEIKG